MPRTFNSDETASQAESPIPLNEDIAEPQFQTSKEQPGVFAKLLVVLPSAFTGGAFEISFTEEVKIFDVSPQSEFSVSAMAW
jgi:hypothetical protein